MALEFLNDAYFAAKVGIGTESPGAVLEIRASSSNPYGALRLSTSSTKYWQFNTIYSSTNPDLFIAPNGGTAAMTLQATGNVGIGTTSPGAKLEINDTNKAINTKGNLFVSTTDTLAVDKGGQISLGGVWSGTSQIQFAGIAGRKENATSGNAGGYLQFSTTVSSGGNLTEKMRITSVGGISFGSTGTAYGTSGQVLTSAGNASPTWTTPTTGSVTSINTGGGLDGGPITGSGTIEVEYDAVSTNVLQSGFDYRNSTIVSGDYVMVSNPSATGTYRRIGYTKVGNLLAAGGGSVSGSGTLNTVPLWTPNGTTLGDSPITISGNNSTFAGTVTAATYYKSSGTSAVLGTNAAGEVLLRPTSSISSTAQSSFTTTLATIGTDATFTGSVTVNASAARILTINRGTASGGYMAFQNNGVDKFYIGTRGVVSGSGGTGYDFYAVGGNDLRFFGGTLLTLTLDTSANATFAGNVIVDSALLSNQENTDVDTGTEAIASVAIATYTAAFFDFVIKKGTNVRSGTVYACHDGTSVAFTETSTQDLGDTSDVTLNVVISTIYLQLQATTTSDDWSVKSLIRAI
jgi:fibronectin-binding autotransporter adhesin